VGLTRARERAWMTWAEKRRLHGSETFGAPSRFLAELPSSCVHHVRTRTEVSRPQMAVRSGLTEDPAEQEPAFTLGQRVRHPKFGDGIVLQYEGQGPSARVQVNFSEAGAKWLVAAYANLESA
ncbi:MAG: DNA helicase II, partial [Ectothiorhodospiraceae bacterium]